MISVIIPTYNRERLLGASIRSVLEQTYRDIEIIVVDDCSSDNTQDVVEAIAEQDGRLRYRKLDARSGACIARNVGIGLAKGDYIAFQDSDDRWRPKKLAIQLEALATYDADVCTCRFERHGFGKNFEVVYPNIPAGILSRTSLITRSRVSTQTILAKREVFNKFIFDSDMHRLQDYEWTIRASESYKFCLADDILVDTYIQDDSITSTSRDVLRDSYKSIWEKHHGTLDLHPEFELAIIPAVGEQTKLEVFARSLARAKVALSEAGEGESLALCSAISNPDILRYLVDYTINIIKELSGRWRGGIYLDFGDGYTREKHFLAQEKTTRNGITTLTWDLDKCCGGKMPLRVRVDPDEGTLRKYCDVQASMDDGAVVACPLNASMHDGAWDIFFTTDPQYELKHVAGTGMLKFSFVQAELTNADVAKPKNLFEHRLAERERELSSLQKANEELRSTTERDARFIKELQNEILQLRREIESDARVIENDAQVIRRLQSDVKKIQKDNDVLKQSFSLRIGRGITYIPRILRRRIRLIRKQ